MAKTEKTTDYLVHDLLKTAGIDARPNKSQIAEIDGALKTASKKGTGQVGRPEFLAVSGGYLLVVEDKADPNRLHFQPLCLSPRHSQPSGRFFQPFG